MNILNDKHYNLRCQAYLSKKHLMKCMSIVLSFHKKKMLKNIETISNPLVNIRRYWHAINVTQLKSRL